MFVGNAIVASNISFKKTSRVKNMRAWKIKQFLKYGWRELPLRLLIPLLPVVRYAIPGLNVTYSTVHLRVNRGDGSIEDYGVHKHLVVTAGKNYLAACMDNTSEPELLKFHGFGTGGTAAAAGDTTLQTELTTQYNPDNTRPTGSQAHSTNTYTTVGTLSPDASAAVTEWGLFTATSAGTLFDRQVFSVINLTSSDSLQATYVLTFS